MSRELHGMRISVLGIATVFILASCTQTEVPRTQTKDEAASPETVLFRSDWKSGQRAEVTEDLVARLKVGMTREQVASILERPSRPSDEITADGGSEEWVFTITLARILILTFEDGKLTNIGGG